MTGTLTFSVFIPADVWITGGISGGETQTGTFKFDLTSAHLPFDDEWAFKGSSYDVKDKVDVTATPPPPTSCSDTYTASATAGGDFPAHQTVNNQTFISADWWASGYDPLIAAGGQVESHEGVKVKVHGGSACGPDSEYTRTYFISPICLKIPESVFTTGGPFDGENDTINLDCNSKIADGVRYDNKGTLHVDAYMFVLPRGAMKPAEWKAALTKEHHTYPAADIPVRDGTPFYAVTAGTVQYVGKKSEKTCGGHVTGPHLHFELRINKVQHCPQYLLWRLYDGMQPPPDAQDVHSLPTTGCFYTAVMVNKKKDVRIEGNEATGLEIKQAAIAQGAGIKLDDQLAEILPDGKHQIIADNEKIHLKDNEKFIATAK